MFCSIHYYRKSTIDTLPCRHFHKIVFFLFIQILSCFWNHFMPLVSLYSSWRRQKTRAFLMFSVGKENDQWHRIDWYHIVILIVLVYSHRSHQLKLKTNISNISFLPWKTFVMESFCSKLMNLQPPASLKKSPSRKSFRGFSDDLRMIDFDFYVGAGNTIAFRRRDLS